MKDYFKKYLKYKKKYLKLIGGANESVGFEYTTKIEELEDKGIFYEAEMDTIYNRNDDITLDKKLIKKINPVNKYITL